MELNWKSQFEHANAVLDEKMPELLSCMATPTQKVRIIRNCILPAVTYGMGVAPYPAGQIKLLDNKLYTAYKKILGYPRDTPTAMMQLACEQMGLDLPSPMADYVAINTACLTQALNDKNLLGDTTRELLALQGQHLVNIPIKAAWIVTTQNTSMKQLRLVEEGGLEMSWTNSGTNSTIYPKGQARPLVDLILECTPTAPVEQLNKLHNYVVC